MDPKHLQHWLTIQNATLILLLDFKYNPKVACTTWKTLKEALARAYPMSASTIDMSPPLPDSTSPIMTPWGFLLKGLNPGQAKTLVDKHLWLSRCKRE